MFILVSVHISDYLRWVELLRVSSTTVLLGRVRLWHEDDFWIVSVGFVDFSVSMG